jgi:oxygen-dependent protoporphyrinogen oxidase
MTVDVVVVGGGIAGLATAYELSRRGIRFVILEHADRAGGVILSEEVDGFAIDGGPDSLLIQKPEGITLCQEIGLGDRLVATKPPRIAFIQRRGRLHPLPAASVLGIPTRVGPFVRTKLFTWRGKLRMGAELFVPRRTDGADESIGSFMRRRFGREATDFLAEPLLAGIHAGDVNRLSLHALFPRFAEAERTHGSLLRAFRANARLKPRAPSSGPMEREASAERNEGAFKSLPGGLSEMIRALVRIIGDANVRTGTEVTGVTGPGPFTVRTAGAASYHARAVVLATPAYVTADILKDRDAEVARRCRDIPYASAVTVALAFRRDAVAHPLDGSGFVVPRSEKNGILAASWLSSKWPGRAPEGRVLMRTFLGGARDPWAIDESDAECVERSMDALRPLLGISGEPLFTRVYRWDRANAQHEVGHLARVAAIDAALARHPGLFLTGSGFRGVGIPDCIADGRKTAAQVDDLLKRQDTVTETTEIRRSSR